MTPRERITTMLAAGVTAVLIYVYPLFLPTPLLEPDEGLHATISQEMLEHGEWIMPRFRGEPFADKPILYFWVQMLSLRAFGMNEFAVRLSGLMFGLLAALTTGILARRLFGPYTGTLACLMSMTMLIPLSLAQAAAHDVAMVPWTNLSLLCLWNLEYASRRRARCCWLLAAAAGIALGVLTKALLGIAFVGIAFAAFLLVSRRLTTGSAFRLAAAFIAGLVLASPWFIAMECRSSGYLYYYFVERHLLGFVTTSQPHGAEPWYYYIPFVTLGAIPWFGYLAPLLHDEWNRRRAGIPLSPQLLLVLSWLIGGLLFLSLAGSKLVTYCLPLFPAMAILSAEAWRRFDEGRWSNNAGLSFQARLSFVRVTRMAGIAGVVVPFLALAICTKVTGSTWPPGCWLCAGIISLISVGSWRIFERGNPIAAVSICCVWIAGFAALAMTWPVQAFVGEYSERSLAEWINQRGRLPKHLIVVGEKPASVVFYLKPELRCELLPDQFVRLDFDQLPTREAPGHGTVLALTQKELQQAERPDLQIPGTCRRTFGQFHIYERNAELQPAQFQSNVEVACQSNVEVAWRSDR